MAERFDLTSADNPRIKAVVRLREQRERRRSGLFVAEGMREITRALEAGLRPVEAFGCPPVLMEKHGNASLSDLAPALADRGARIFTVSPPLLAKLTYCENPEGAAAVFEQPAWELSQNGLPREKDELWLVAVGTEKPGNLGAMVRSAEAAGARGVLVGDGVVDPFNPNAIRASTCAVFSLPVIGGNRETILTFLRDRGVRVVASTPVARKWHTDTDLRGDVAIVIGPEDAGLDEAWLAAAGENRVAIPMKGRLVDSLNASVSAAVLLFEALRQRGR